MTLFSENMPASLRNRNWIELNAMTVNEGSEKKKCV